MPGGELQPPAEYAQPWMVYAMFAVIAVAVYYLIVWTLTRPRRRSPARSTVSRGTTLERLSTIEADVREDRISPRVGHQRISQTVRGFAAERTGLGAQSMTLEDLRGAAPSILVDLVVRLYPPEFAPGDDLPREAFDDTLAKARELVQSWR
jgi:hypothetical protein